MEWFVRAFVRASVAWFALGITLGLGIAAHPAWIVYRPAHVHMNLVGFVSMMIFGVAYHVMPRFSGHQLASRTLAGWHWWISNAGLAGMVTGFMLQPHGGRHALACLVAGGVLETIGAYLFVYNIWRTLSAGEVPAPGPPVRPMPVRR